jgi:hypothetical protein
VVVATVIAAIVVMVVMVVFVETLPTGRLEPLAVLATTMVTTSERHAPKRHRQRQHQRRDQQRNALFHLLTSSPFSPTRKPAYLSLGEIAGCATGSARPSFSAHL